MQGIKETVGVEVSFWGQKMIPIRFVWNGRRHEVKRVRMNPDQDDSGKKYLSFAVDTGVISAELVLDRESLVWELRSLDVP